MAYTKQTWACGDEITAEKLNHIEDGIENAGGNIRAVIAGLYLNNSTTLQPDESFFLDGTNSAFRDVNFNAISYNKAIFVPAKNKWVNVNSPVNYELIYANFVLDGYEITILNGPSGTSFISDSEALFNGTLYILE